jgi:hypothetical protein
MVKITGKSEGGLKNSSSSVWSQLLYSLLIIVILDFLSGFIIISDNFTSFRNPHYYYHHGLQPSKDAWAAWGSLLYPFRTNSLGMVDSAVYNVKLKPDKQRILILGDSHSEGVGVPYNKTFSGILSKRLKQDVEILNASCISYSPKIEYLRAKYLFEQGLKVDHIIVFIDISDMQNELVYERFEPKNNSMLQEFRHRSTIFLKKHSAVFHLVSSINTRRKTTDFFKKASLFNQQGSTVTPANVIDLYASFFSGFDDKVLLSNPQFHGVGEWYYKNSFRKLADRGISLGQDNILKLKKLCDSQDVDLTISVHPWQYQILKGDDHDYYVEKWESFASANEIGFINLFSLFIDGQNPVINIRKYLIKGDNHWNEFGHVHVANYLEQYFKEGLISEIR